MANQTLDTLKAHIQGNVIVPGDPDYDQARNAYGHEGRPAVVVQPKTEADVAAAIAYAREHELKLAVRSGGHGFSGLSTNDGGLVIDLALFQAVEVVDAQRRLVRLGGGARWGTVAKTLDEHGWALSSGDTNSVGVGGLTLGGGVGWLVRKYGLAIDSLRAVELVMADGQTLRASAEERPDLFWAVRGGGGNFGVATAFEFEAHPLRSILGGQAFYPVSEAGQVLRGWAGYMRTAPEELNSTVVLMPGFGEQVPPSVMVIICYGGEDETAGTKLVQPLLELGTVQHQAVAKKPYYEMLQDAAPPPGLKPTAQVGFVKELTPQVLETLATHYGQPGTPIVQIRSLGGAMRRIDSQATAFAHRDYEALLWSVSLMPLDTPEADARQASQAAWEPLKPFTEGAYVNFQTDAEEASVKAAYPPATYAKLAEVKAKYDPTNVFNQNANIKPR